MKKLILFLSLIIIPVTVYSATSPRTTMQGGADVNSIAVIHLNETSGTSFYNNVNGSAGTVTNAGWGNTNEFMGSYLAFDGDSIAQIAVSGLNCSQGSVSCWVNVGTWGDDQGLVYITNNATSGSSGMFRINQNNGDGDGIDFMLHNFGTTTLWRLTCEEPSANVWHRLTLVVDANGIRFFIDGSKMALRALTGTAANTEFLDDATFGYVDIGGRNIGSLASYSTNASIDEVVVTSRAYSDAEESYLYRRQMTMLFDYVEVMYAFKLMEINTL